MRAEKASKFAEDPETVKVETKNLLVNTKVIYKIVSTGTGEIVANTALKMYASIVKGVTDAVKVKDSKNSHQKFQKENMYKGGLVT